MPKVAVGRIGSVLFDTPATLLRVGQSCREAAESHAQLLVLPEALLGGYPKGLNFGAVIGSRSDAGRERFRRYFEAAIRVPGPETEQLASWSAELRLHLVIGVVERDGATLYCTSLLFSPDRGLLAKHRKLMPTGTERLIWGMGDASTMKVTETEIGRIGMAICWENYMPLYRQHLYNQGVELWCAPTVDMRDIWQTTIRHIAYEGRCFVLSACQNLTIADWPNNLQAEGGTIEGRSLIATPSGGTIGPLVDEQLLFADLDLAEIARGKFDLDVAGHYNRPDIFDFRIK